MRMFLLLPYSTETLSLRLAQFYGARTSSPKQSPHIATLKRLNEPWAIIAAAIITGIFGIIAVIVAAAIQAGNNPSGVTPTSVALAAQESQTPTPIFTWTPLPTDPPTLTSTLTSTETVTASPTTTDTLTPSATSTDTPTSTDLPTETHTPSVTPTDIPSPTVTYTPTSTSTSTATTTDTPAPSPTVAVTSTNTAFGQMTSSTQLPEAQRTPGQYPCEGSIVGNGTNSLFVVYSRANTRQSPIGSIIPGLSVTILDDTQSGGRL